MRNALKTVLWPAVIAAAVVDGCWDVVWYCLIAGRPAWLDGRNPARDVAGWCRAWSHVDEVWR